MDKNKKSYFKRIVNKIISLIYPPKCIFCNSIMPIGTDIEICNYCYGKIKFIKGKTCIICGQELDKRTLNNKCFDCRRSNYYFEHNISPCRYNSNIRQAIINLKFFGKKRYAKTLGQLMIKKLKENTEMPIINIVTYVPLNNKKKIERGFNQAQLLAKELAGYTNCKTAKNLLIKTKATLPQEKLNKHQRLKNIKGVFKVKDKNIIKDKVILLVDDVYTTGATVNECAKVLKTAGACKVYVITVAIGKGYL